MHVVGSIIARLASKRLAYKNILPFNGKPLVSLGIEILNRARLVDEVVISTESELIARIVLGQGGTVLFRPPELALDTVPSIPVFQHIVSCHPCDVHVNFNVNFPMCAPEVIDRGVEKAIAEGEALSVPYAVWAQTSECLANYGNPRIITGLQHLFADDRAGPCDVHTIDDLLETYRAFQGPTPPGLPGEFVADA